MVHAWNGYGDKDKFLPPRLAEKIEPYRSFVVALKDERLSITKLIMTGDYYGYNGLTQRSDGALILGGCDKYVQITWPLDDSAEN